MTRNDKLIAVLGTGGTIAGTASCKLDNVGYTAAQLGVDELLKSFAAPSGISLVSEQVAQMDSKDMDLETWRRLAIRCAHWLARRDVAGIVVVHGTDTLEETAYFLHAVLAPVKPIVLASAMRPATALTQDGPQNMLDAVTLAAAACAGGVVAVSFGEIHGAADVAKQHTYKIAPFSSGDAGPIGYVEQGRLRLLRPFPGPSKNAAELFDRVIKARTWPRVEIVMSHAGATGMMVEAAAAQPLDGLVVAGSGNGTIHRDLERALQEAMRAGIRVLRTTRCANGRIIAGRNESIAATELSPVKARIRLMLDLLASN